MISHLRAFVLKILTAILTVSDKLKKTSQKLQYLTATYNIHISEIIRLGKCWHLQRAVDWWCQVVSGGSERPQVCCVLAGDLVCVLPPLSCPPCGRCSLGPADVWWCWYWLTVSQTAVTAIPGCCRHRRNSHCFGSTHSRMRSVSTPWLPEWLV